MDLERRFTVIFSSNDLHSLMCDTVLKSSTYHGNKIFEFIISLLHDSFVKSNNKGVVRN